MLRKYGIVQKISKIPWKQQKQLWIKFRKIPTRMSAVTFSVKLLPANMGFMGIPMLPANMGIVAD